MSDKSVCKEEPELIICTKKEESPETLLVFTCIQCIMRKRQLYSQNLIYIVICLFSGQMSSLHDKTNKITYDPVQ